MQAPGRASKWSRIISDFGKAIIMMIARDSISRAYQFIKELF